MLPSVGRIVHYLDREAVMAHGEKASPYGATITRVVLNERVDLGVFHPELGYQIKRDVDMGDHVGGWSWPPMAGPAKVGQQPMAPVKEPPAARQAPKTPAESKPKKETAAAAK